MIPTLLLLLSTLSVAVSSAQLTQEEAVELAKGAVEDKTEVDPSNMRVRTAEPVQWPDTSLGCAKEGMMYAQVITPGYRIFLQVKALIYQVHVGGGRAVICSEPIDRGKALPVKIPEEETSQIKGEVPDELIEAIVEDLGERLGVELDAGAVEVFEAESLTWNDGSLGCPQPGELYTQVPVEGYRVVLEHQGKKYDYRAAESGHFKLCNASARPKVREKKPPAR